MTIPEAQKQTVLRLMDRYCGRPMETLDEGQRVLAGDCSGGYRHCVQAIVLQTTRNILAFLDETSEALFEGKPRDFFADLEKKLMTAQEQLETEGVGSDRLERFETNKQQFYHSPLLPVAKAIAAHAEAIDRPEHQAIADNARGGNVLDALVDGASLSEEVDSSLLEVLAGKTYEALLAQRALKKPGWEDRAQNLVDAFERLATKFYLPFYLGEAALYEIVESARQTKSEKQWLTAQRLTPVLVTSPSLAFALARQSAGQRDKHKLLRYLRRAFVLARDRFDVDDPEFAPYLEDADFKALLDNYPLSPLAIEQRKWGASHGKT